MDILSVKRTVSEDDWRGKGIVRTTRPVIAVVSEPEDCSFWQPPLATPWLGLPRYLFPFYVYLIMKSP